MQGLEASLREPLFDYLLRLGDDQLILGHRLSEWCGHGPILEQDIALTNISLDCIGQAEAYLDLAGKVEGADRTSDDLAYLRGDIDFRNALIVEQPNGDFACTMARQFLYDAYSFLCCERLSSSPFQPLAGIAAKCLTEVKYHLRHSGDWMLRLGDGTEESHGRTQRALDDLWMYTNELFEPDERLSPLLAAELVPDPHSLESRWRELVGEVIAKATLRLPEAAYQASGGRSGRHSEHLGHLLSEMQILHRSIPGADW